MGMMILEDERIKKRMFSISMVREKGMRGQ